MASHDNMPTCTMARCEAECMQGDIVGGMA